MTIEPEREGVSGACRPRLLIVGDDVGLSSELEARLRSADFDGRVVRAVDLRQLNVDDPLIAGALLHGPDSIGVARQLRAVESLASLPIMFVTTAGEALDLREVYALDAVDHLARADLAVALVPRLGRLLRLEARPAPSALRRLAAGKPSIAGDGRATNLLGLSDIGIGIIDVARRMIDCDTVLARLYGLEPDVTSVPLDTILERVHPDDRQQVADIFERAVAERRMSEFDSRLQRADGGWLRVLVRAWVEDGDAGYPLRVPYALVDVTALREIETAHRETEHRYRNLIESIEEGFAIIELIDDANGEVVDYRFLEINAAFESQTGLANARGRRVLELLPTLDRAWIEQFDETARTGQPSRRIGREEQLDRWFEVGATRVGGSGSRQVALLFRDITVREQHEQDLTRFAAESAAADRRKTDFLATLAHELRNPLAPLRSGLELLRPDDSRGNADLDTWKMLGRQLDQLVHLVDDLLDIARIDRDEIPLRRSRVMLVDIINEALESARATVDAHEHRLEIDLGDRPLPIFADRMRMAQVVANLLGNAAKYTPNGGVICVRTWREGDDACLSVSDTGIGIATENIERVFEMFTRLELDGAVSPSGLGVGLMLARRLVDLHDGRIEATSEGRDRGSTFTLRLPLTDEGSPGDSSAIKPASPKPTKRALSLLVVDDNHDAATALARLLRRDGHHVVLAADGAEAVALARDTEPDAIFLDIGLPDIDGLDLAPKLRAIAGLEAVAIVALTGYGSEADRARSDRAGFDHHLTKPARFATVRALLVRLFEETSAGGRAPIGDGAVHRPTRHPTRDDER